MVASTSNFMNASYFQLLVPKRPANERLQSSATNLESISIKQYNGYHPTCSQKIPLRSPNAPLPIPLPRIRGRIHRNVHSGHQSYQLSHKCQGPTLGAPPDAAVVSPTDSDVFILLPTYVVLCYAQDVASVMLLRHYLWNGEGGFDGAVGWKRLGWVDAVCDMGVGRPRGNVLKWEEKTCGLMKKILFVEDVFDERMKKDSDQQERTRIIQHAQTLRCKVGYSQAQRRRECQTDRIT
jgi:hypothetical protein